MEQNVLDGMYEQLGISKEVLDYAADIEKSLKERFERIDQTAEYNQLKVLKGMQDNKVSDIHFAATTGYGYNDLGRDTLEDVYASVFHAESALVRPQLISGTHALHIALSGNLRPGDELLSPVGKPYDTLEEVIGIRDSVGSLKEYGVSYRQVDLLPDGTFDRRFPDQKPGRRPCSYRRLYCRKERVRRPCILPFKRSRPWKRSRRKPWFKPAAVSGIFLIPDCSCRCLKGCDLCS